MAKTDARPPVPNGAIFDGRYRVLERIGRGGMGDVYVAEEVNLQRRCALKVLGAEFTDDADHVERFLREAKTMARFSHPNIVGIFAYGQDPLGVYFAMELLTGEDLDARVKARRQRPYSLADCCAWAIEIARAVGVVHRAGLIHRDLKTSNIFLARQDDREVVKLLDFGIARPVDESELTKTGVSLGTPTYMSPEQVLNAPLDHRTDIYAFGVLLFKLLTGRVPFTGEAIQVTSQHCMVPPPVPSAVAPAAAIPPELDRLVLRAMAKKPDERPASMQEIEQILLDVSARLSGGSTPLRTVSLDVVQADIAESLTTQQGAAGHLGGRARRGPLVFAGLGAAALLAIVAASLTAGAPPVAVEPPPIAAAEPPPPAEPRPESPPVPPAPAPPASEPDPDPDPAAARSKPRGARGPIAQIKKKAAACRKANPKQVDARVTVEYVIGIDGKVTRATPSVRGALGTCLERAVTGTTFDPAPRVRFEEIDL